MLLQSLILAAVVHGAEIVSIRPAAQAPTIHYRETLRTFLRTSKFSAALPALKKAIPGVRPATAIQIALEETKAYADEWRSKSKSTTFPPVIHRVFEQLATIQIGAVTADERTTMRKLLKPYLDLHFQDRKATNSLRFAVTIYDRLGPRGPKDLKYLVEDIKTMPYLIGAYRQILAVAPALDRSDADLLRDAILRNPGKALMRWTILDEIGLLPPELLRGGLDLLMHEMLPGAEREISHQDEAERRVYLGALGRWQERYQNQDSVMTAVADAAAIALIKREHRDEEGRFMSRFMRGMLPTESTASRLSSLDPLGLLERPAPVDNVIPFDCNIELKTVVAPL